MYKALRQEVALGDILKEPRALELSDKHASENESGTNKETSALRHKHSKQKQIQHKTTSKYKQDFKSQTEAKTTCRNSGYEFPHKNGFQCPAKGKSCTFCSKQNHFEAVCMSKRDSQKVYDT